MSTELLVIVDDTSSAFSYSWSGGNTPSPWTTSTLPQWYKTTSRFPSSTSTKVGEFTFTFNGTSAAFFGNTPPSSAPQTATVRIDNGTSFVINYQDPNPQSYMQWFTTPALPDGNHAIKLSNLSLISIDYAIVKVGSRTPLTGQNVIVDDDSPLIAYSGQWSRSAHKFIPGNLPTGYPYSNVTHRSSNVGDTFTFRFSGTSIAVYGIFSWYNLGSLTMTYTLDGTPYPSSTAVTTSSSGYLNRDGDVSNYLYFGQDDLSSGPHTLVVNVTEATNQVFILDYITYRPSFATLSSMPSLPLDVSSSSSVASATILASSTAGSLQTVPVGAIVGGVFGGVVIGILVSILIVLLVLRKRRREQNCATSVVYPDYPCTSIYSSQTQEHSPALQPVRRPMKLVDGGWSASANDGHSPSMSASMLLTGHSTGHEDSLVHPPSYYAISTRAPHQA